MAAPPYEIERKFLVRDAGWRATADAGVRYRQGYLAMDPHGATVRVRIGGGTAYLGVKGPPLDARGRRRVEFEYAIPVSEAEQLLAVFCAGRGVEKTRYRVAVGNSTWEVDEFHGRHAGLTVAEIELTEADQTFESPPWLGEEVTGDPSYTNAALAGAVDPHQHDRESTQA